MEPAPGYARDSDKGDIAAAMGALPGGSGEQRSMRSLGRYRTTAVPRMVSQRSSGCRP